jgi:lipopolysaccharide transport system permease protein
LNRVGLIKHSMASTETLSKMETAPVAAAKTLPVIRVEASTGWLRLDLAAVWAHRELLYFLIWREIKVRYKQTALGAIWALLQPLMTMLVFTLFFGRLAKVPSDGIPYPIFAFSGLVPWTFFANAVTLSSNCLVNSANLITKVYFPRLTIPTAAVLSGLVDFAIAFAFLLLMMMAYKIRLTEQIVFIPFFVLLAIITALGVGLWLSAINVKYRDVRHTVPFLTQFWMFATPIVYPSSMLHEQWQRTIYGLNPMVGVIEGFRWSLLGSATKPGIMLAISTASALALLVSGAYYFRRMERTFADLV